jgi:predicted nucleic acid-binding protein
MLERVICNTSPLFYLHRIRRLDILRKLYGTIAVPETVKEELGEGGALGEDVPDITEYDWIRVIGGHIPKLIKLVTDLGPGEAGVLALALDVPEALVILDDRLARRIAELQGLKITGTAGVLLKAKRKGHIDIIAPVIDQLIGLGFRLSEHLQNDILRLAGETGESHPKINK